jgi:anti-anti-sigma factor
MLNLRMQKLGNTVIVHCVGRVTFPDADALHTLTVQEPHAPCLVLDLQNVTAIDAAGLGALVSLQSWSKRTGKTLKLMNVGPQVQVLLELTNLRSTFHVCSGKEMLSLLCRALNATKTEIFAAQPQAINHTDQLLCPA